MNEAMASALRRSAQWVHVGVLVAFGLAIELVVRLSWAQANAIPAGEAIGQFLREGPGLTYHLLPLAAAISVLLIDASRPTRRNVLRLGMVCMAAMLILDIAFAPKPIQVGERLVEVSGQTTPQPVFSDFGEVSVTRTVARYLAGDLDRTAVEERVTSYPPDHPRRLVGLALLKGGYLLLPLLLALTVAGILAWADREIVFRTPQAARLFSVAVAWVTGPTIYAFVHYWAYRAWVSAMVGGGALPTILIPYVPLGVLAWTVGRNLSRTEASPDLVHH